MGKDKNAGRRGCNILGLLFGGLSPAMMLVVLIAGIIVLIGFASFFSDPVDSVLGLFGFERDSEAEEVDSRIIMLGIREMALLQTASGDIHITKEVIDAGAAPDARLRMAYVGSVNVGIDLERLTEENVVVNADNSLTITLPPIQILECALRQPEIVSMSCTDIPFVQDCDDIRTKLQDAAYERSMNELREQAQQNEIFTSDGQRLLDVAYDGVEEAVYNLVVTLDDGLDDVRVQFVRNPEQLPPGETCFP